MPSNRRRCQCGHLRAGHRREAPVAGRAFHAATGDVGGAVGQRGSVQLARDITRDVWQHPANQSRRWRAVGRALAWQVYKRTVRRPLTARVYGGMRLRLQPESGSCSNFVYFGERFEYDVTGFVQRFLRSADNAIDGGANIGAYTLLMAGIVQQGRVDSYEPSARHADWLRENVELNLLSNVHLHEAALTDHAGTVRFSEGLDVSNMTVEADYEGHFRDVVSEILADVLDERRYALAKLDLEGGEYAALVGAGDHLLSGNPAVILVEVMQWQLAKHSSSVAAVCDLLRSSGYVLGIFDADANSVRPVRDLPGRRENNLIAIHASASQMVTDRLASRGGA